MTPLINFEWAFFPQLFVALFLIIQATVVLIQNPKNSLHKTFFFMHAPITLWLVSMSLAYAQKDAHTAYVLSAVGFSGVMFIPVTAYAFSVYFLGDRKQMPMVFDGVALTLLASLFIPHPSFTQGVWRYSWGYYIRLGPLSILSMLLFALGIPLFLRNLYKKYLLSPPEQKRWHMAALAAGGLAFFGALDYFPAFGIDILIPPVGYLFVGGFVTLMGYFMLRHHLSDLKIIFGKTVGYGMLSVFLFFIYTGFFLLFFPAAETRTELFVNAGLFILLLYVASYVKQKSQGMLDEVFFKEKISYQAKAAQLSVELRNLIDTKTFLRTVFLFFKEQLRISESHIFFFEEKERAWHIYSSSLPEFTGHTSRETPFSKNFSQYFLSRPEVIDARDYLYHPLLDETRREILNIIRQYKASLLIPMTSHGNLLGLIALGPKFSSESYTQREKQALENIANPLGIAWENARLYENIQKAGRLKTDFVSIVSHQLRTPLSYFRWSLKVLADKEFGALSPGQEKIIHNLSSSADRLTKIVNQLLDIIRLEADDEEPHLEKLDIAEIVEEVIEDKRITAEKKNIGIAFDPPKTPFKAFGNEEYTAIVFSILLENAIKYSYPGSKIAIGLERQDQKLVVSIRDTGIGISREEAQNIFTKFFRSLGAQAMEPNGSGLGLYYAKMILEKMHGEIWFRSEENHGSTFYCAFPMAKNLKNNA